MKKWILITILGVFLISGCATTPVKYEARPFIAPTKTPEYKLPIDPFQGTEPPKQIFLAKAELEVGNYWKEVPKEQATIIGYVSKEHDKIVIRLGYYKQVMPELENLINIHIRRENVLIDLIVDQNVLKELFREMNVELQNKMSSQEFWNKIQQGGYWVIILGLLIEMGLIL